jgi:two-component system osmolarity sensor histidine kinase EnvZ
VTLWPRSLLWRTVLLLALLLGVAQLAWLLLSGWSEREMRARQIGDQAVALIGLSRAALLAAEPAQRSRLLARLSGQQGLRLVPARERTPVAARFEPRIINLVRRQIHEALGESTMVVLDRSRPRALWVSLDIEGERYWVVLSRTRVERPLPWRWIGWGALVLAMSVAGAYLIVHRIGRPLHRLTAAAAALGRGEPPGQLPEDGPAELRVLTRTFNQMTLDLARLESDRAVLLAGVSHDLRTPLSRLRLAVEMLPDETARPGMIQDIEDMDAIIGQFLAFVREGDSETQAEADLNALVVAVCDRYARAGHEIQTELGALPSLVLRPTAIQRLISNLVDNALRHGRGPDAAAEICIQTRLQDSHAYLSVLDRGPGIPEDEMERMRKPFTQLGAARGGSGGSGLGLAIVERIARMHGGRLRLQRRAGGGLDARVELPVGAQRTRG